MIGKSEASVKRLDGGPLFRYPFAMTRIRLDVLLHERGLVESRETAKRLILAGHVLVNGQVASKAGVAVEDTAQLQIQQGLPYVSRGGFKLEKALRAFGLSPQGLVAADVGASTGGFTDCLLQQGAARVYALDVGYGQLDWSLRQDARVVVMERTNARYVETLPEPVALVTIDVSFISLRLVLPQVQRWLAEGGQVVALIKPQFEAGAGQVGKGGVVREERVHRQVLRDVLGWAIAHGWALRGLTRSPLKGPKGNIEFLAWLAAAAEGPGRDLEAAIETTMQELQEGE
jgi:23S rRNA (cytidine1920-2'-O)/16S rRNA (cytidine1409-2'-O)-methyltransferase